MFDQRLVLLRFAALRRYGGFILLFVGLLVLAPVLLVVLGMPTNAMTPFVLIASGWAMTISVLPAVLVVMVRGRRHVLRRQEQASSHPDWVDRIGYDRWYRSHQATWLAVDVPQAQMFLRLLPALAGLGAVAIEDDALVVRKGRAMCRCEFRGGGHRTFVAIVASTGDIFDPGGELLPMFIGVVNAFESVSEDDDVKSAA